MEKRGNWRDSRNTWTQKARSNWSTTTGKYIKKPVVAGLILEQPLIEYYGDDKARAAVLARTLFEDIYQIDILPYHISQSIRKNYSFLESIGQEIADLIEELGDYSVVYSRNKSGGELVINSNYLFLNTKPVGMPLKDFLIWYKGCRTPADVIAEWTGIPLKKVRVVYADIIKAFQRALTYYHLRDQKTQETPQTINVNITVSADNIN